MTVASVIDSQKPKVMLRLHFAVVSNFSTKNILKIYSLRDKFKHKVEFNFYNAKRVEKELNDISYKGPGLAAKLILPQLVTDDVERLIILDIGDTLVLGDLFEMYNWNMKNNIYMGVPDPGAGKFGKISNKTLEVYINAGTYLIDVKKVKLEKIYDKYIKYKNVYNPPFAEQDMINDISYGKIGYLPVIFGLVPAYNNDKISYEIPLKKTIFQHFNLNIISKNNSFLPKNYVEFLHQAFNPIIVHQWNGKWSDGNGLNIYRKLCQYYIKLAGIWDEMCKKHSGYCKK